MAAPHFYHLSEGMDFAFCLSENRLRGEAKYGKNFIGWYKKRILRGEIKKSQRAFGKKRRKRILYLYGE
jgi:hypothetical protein